jgi:hypothetical protein
MGFVSYVLTHDDLVEKLRQQLGFLRHSAALFDQGSEDEALRLAQLVRILVHATSSSHSLLSQLGVKETFDYLDTSEPIDPRNLLATMGLVAAKIEFGSGDSVGTYVAPLDGDHSRAESKRPHNRSGRKTKKRRKKPRPQPGKPGKGIAFIRGAFIAKGAPPDPPDPPDPPPYSRQKPFAEWWNDPVTKDSQGATFARRNYVLGCANKEGGAHVDPSLDAEWAGLTRNNTLHLRITSAGMEFVVAPGSGGEEIQLGNPALASVRQIAYEVDHTLRSQLSHLL